MNDKTFAAIEKLKEVELELHRLKNALEMMNRANETKKEWVGLTDMEIVGIATLNQGSDFNFARAIEAKLREKNGA